ncbi:hypothetical protein [Streptomyces cinereoruber]|uniref:hypothetical protein n=1 Tax=Streptomyces cinereoruber TaxID=67260 RepID=UPI003652EB0E
MNEPLPDALKNRCKCSHSSFQHQYAELDGPCSKPDCDCQAYAPVTVETVELPEPECPTACREGHTYSGSCLNRSHGPRPGPCQCGCAAGAHMGRPTGCLSHGFHEYEPASPGRDDAPAEPEECEHSCSCGHEHCDHSSSGYCKQCSCEDSNGHYPNECDATPSCVCEHAKADHDETQICYACECGAYRPDRPEPGGCAGCGSQDSWVDRSICAEPCGSMHDCCSNCGAVLGYCALEHLPQPERRPPLRVAYSVAGGHAYEVCVPGDVAVTAQDGALIITHPEAQVLAIVRVAPFKEGS